jgi:PHD/YefM family antitoxin component YafN of YafNO toxin-antitoxin module
MRTMTSDAHEVSDSDVAILITNKRADGGLVSEEDGRAVQETLHLLSIPGMRKSIMDGMEIPAEDCEETPSW